MRSGSTNWAKMAEDLCLTHVKVFVGLSDVLLVLIVLVAAWVRGSISSLPTDCLGSSECWA